MKPTLSTINPITKVIESTSKNNLSEIKNAIKELTSKFSEITEIGRFEPIKVDIINPLPNSRFKKASMIIQPSVNPEDFRTRVLTFRTYSPKNELITHEMSPASGNKFSIESTLKNPKLAKVFEQFLNSAESVLHDSISLY